MRVHVVRVPYDAGNRGVRMGKGPERLGGADRLRSRDLGMNDKTDASCGHAHQPASHGAARQHQSGAVKDPVCGMTVDVATATPEQLSELPGIGEKKAEKILAAARGEAPVEETQQE